MKKKTFEKMTLVIVGILVAALIITVAIGVVFLTTPKYEIQCLVAFGIVVCSALGLFIYWHRAYKRFNDLEADEDNTVGCDKESKQNAVYVCFVGNGPEARRQTAFSIRDLCVKKTEADAIAWFRKQYRQAGEVLDSKADISDDFIRNSLRTTGEYHATVFADFQNNWEDCYDLNIQKTIPTP